jgi:hypothetical protein
VLRPSILDREGSCEHSQSTRFGDFSDESTCSKRELN